MNLPQLPDPRRNVILSNPERNEGELKDLRLPVFFAGPSQ